MKFWGPPPPLAHYLQFILCLIKFKFIFGLSKNQGLYMHAKHGLTAVPALTTSRCLSVWQWRWLHSLSHNGLLGI